MIKLTPPISYLRPDNYLATKRTIESISTAIFDSTTSCKDYYVCSDSCLPVFANLSDANVKFNDLSSFLYETATGSTVTATLSNSSGFTVDIVDSTYGDFYALNTLKNRYWGLVLNWRTIAGLEGFDKYNLTIVIDGGGGSRTREESFCFRVAPFSCTNADGTVRITTYKNGYIENGLDYRNLSIGDWVTQTRLNGSFKLDEENVEIDNLQLNNGDLHQIQTKITDNFDLTIKQVSSAVSTSVIKDDLLANKMQIDDYNNNNVIDYKKQFVSLLSIDKPIQHEYNGTLSYIIKLTEYNQSTRKRNF